MEISPSDEYAAIAQGVKFRLLSPADPVTEWWRRVARWCHRLGTTLDYLNTKFPHPAGRVKRTLGPLKDMPRMSTVAIAGLINLGVARMSPGEAFVNIGVWHGYTFLSGMVGNPEKSCVGVDNFSEFEGPREAFLDRFARLKSPAHQFHCMDYREYFAKVHQGPIGFYFYDGEHSYQNQFDGLRVAEPFFGPNCVVMVDDTNVGEPRQATRDFIARSSCKWQELLDVTTARNSHPTWWNGVMLFRRVG